MRRLIPDQLCDLMRLVLMRYTPHAMKLMPREKLLDELAAAFTQSDVLSFTRPGGAPEAYGTSDPERAAAIKREGIRSADFEKALRVAVLSILAVAEVRQR